MSRRTQDLLLALRIVSDVLMVSLAWVLAYAVRFSGALPTPKGVPEPFLYLKLLPFMWIVWLIVFAGSGFYKRTGRHRSAFLEALDILQSSLLAVLGFIAFTYVYEEYRYSRIVMAIFALFCPSFVIIGRSLIRKALRRYKRRAPARRTLIIGGGETLRHAIELSRQGELTRGEIPGVILIGDDTQVKEGEELCRSYGIKTLPLQNDWADFFSKNPTESVVFALCYKAYDFVEQNLDKIADQVTDVKVIPDFMRFGRFAAGFSVINGSLPILSIHESPLEGMGSVIKRLLDIVGASFAVLLFSPIMLTAAIAVRLSSPGPVFYRQERMGLDGKTFYMLKFRSMPIDAEKVTGAVWAKENDNRATRVGAFLRKTSLDELPQFFNVLRGDMSLVGPRPERPVFVEQFRRQVPGYYLRHKTKAGITGWAQVNGWRGNTSIEKRIECDLFYIQNWSLWFDIRIMLLTIFHGFINKNAY